MIAGEARLLKPLEPPIGDQPPRTQVEKVWPIHLLWESLPLPHLSGISDSIWSFSPQPFGENMLEHLVLITMLL